MPDNHSRYSSHTFPSTRDARLSWTIWWDMHRRASSEGWSRAMESSEEDALQRTKRFLKLGFVVYAIKDPNGATFMDEAQIADHFAPREPRVVVSDGHSS
jgi:hypothetical protein